MGKMQKVERLSVQDYLFLEERSDERHEYVAGAIYAMVGSTARHNLISTAIVSILRAHLKGRNCTTFMSDMKVRIDDVFYYPDVMVVCARVDPKSLFQTTPTLVIEVLSPSTEAKDRLEKLVAYQRIESLREYVLVAQDKIKVDVYRRIDDGWQLESVSYNESVTLDSIGFHAPVEAFYEDVLGTV